MRNVLQMNLAQSPIFIQVAFVALCVLAVCMSAQQNVSVWKDAIVGAALAWLSSMRRSSDNNDTGAWIFPERESSGEIKNESDVPVYPTLLY